MRALDLSCIFSQIRWGVTHRQTDRHTDTQTHRQTHKGGYRGAHCKPPKIRSFEKPTAVHFAPLGEPDDSRKGGAKKNPLIWPISGAPARDPLHEQVEETYDYPYF